MLILLAARLSRRERSRHDRAQPGTSFLPQQFGGWQISGSPQTSNDPRLADPANAALLKEYGFTDFESATYARDDGRKLTLKAARFADASGAYGAFTFYKLPQMLKETIPRSGRVAERARACFIAATFWWTPFSRS